MSGHSKWSQIKHQKGITDQKRGQMFTKLGNAIAITVKESGGVADPNSNFKLRLAIEKARQANMPKSNIDKAIERGLGKGEEGSLEEITYEGYGPGKVAILIQAATDNRQRTYAKLKNIFSEFGGNLAGPGSVAYFFQNCGAIRVKKENLTADQYLEIALAVGSQDFEDVGESIIFYTEVSDLHKIKELLEAKKLNVIESELVFRPTTTIKIEDKETAEKLLNLVNKLEEDDDVQKVSANFDIPESLLC